MTTDSKAPLSDPADHMDKEASKLQHYSTIIPDFIQAGYGSQHLVITRSLLPTSPAAKPPLPPREQRCLDALIAHPAGIKSYDLRELTCCSYVPAVIQRLKAKGYGIGRTMEPDGFTAEGRRHSIGWYRLMGFAGEVKP